MKRLLIIIGLVALPSTSMAAALSPWVQAVVERTDAGIRMAKTLTDAQGCGTDPAVTLSRRENLIDNTLTTLRPYVDVQQQISTQSQKLNEWTTCFASDVNLLERKLDEIRVALDSGIEACNGPQVQALRANYTFTAEAATALLKGGADPSYKDSRLAYTYAFHDIELWNAGTERAPLVTPVDLCPYTTDYSPRSVAYVPSTPTDTGIIDTQAQAVKSFGCDATVLTQLTDPTDSVEAQPRLQFLAQTETQSTLLSRMVTQFLQNLDAALSALHGAASMPPPLPEPFSPLEHGKQSGCLKPALQAPGSVDLLLNDYPDYFGSQPAPGQMLPVGMFLRPTYDSFSLLPNAPMTLRAFIERKNDQGVRRPFPWDMQSNGTDYFSYIFSGSDAPQQLQIISSGIDRETGFVDALGRDSIERTTSAFSPLRTAVNSLAQATRTTVPDYVSDLSYFLARQCVDGHCQSTLDGVLKRIHNPYCTPYTEGLYTDDRAHVYCFCLEKSAEVPNGLDLGNANDRKLFDQYCREPTAEEVGEYKTLEPKMVGACMVRNQ